MSSKNKLIINCGATHVSAAEFAVSSGTLKLVNFQAQELLYDYSIQEEWLPALTKALRSMKVSGKASVIAPASWMLTKTIKVPHVEGGVSRQQEVIRFEAEKNIPYALSDVTWDYQVISDDGVETEILLISMRASAADELCSALAAGGVEPEIIEASSILEYNAWKYLGLEDDVIILNVGARSSNMLIARSDGLFVRSIPIGGIALTQAISDSMGQSFSAAEDLKKRYFANAGAFDGNVGSEHFKTAASSVMKRIGMEIKRSIVNYRRRGKVATPTKIFLTGKASILPGFAEFLAEDQKMSVSYLDALDKIVLAPSVNQDLLRDYSAQISELVGEAARSIISGGVGVNLLPKHILDERAFRRKKPFMILGAALLVSSTIPPFMMFNKDISQNIKLAREFDKPVEEMRARTEAMEANRDLAAKTIKKIEDLEGLAESKSNWINLFIDLEKRLMEHKDVWLDDLRVVREGDGKKQKYNLELTGRMLVRGNSKDMSTYDSKAANERITPLLESFISSSFLKSYENVSTDPSNPRILKFKFTLVVNPDKPI